MFQHNTTNNRYLDVESSVARNNDKDKDINNESWFYGDPLDFIDPKGMYLVSTD